MKTINLSDFEDGPKIFPLKSFEDSRGSFSMIYQISELRKMYPNLPEFGQLNVIRAKNRSLRGFHGASEEASHWKLVTCLAGEVIEGFLDIRSTSQSFGMAATSKFRGPDPKIIIIPPGFAHAFQSLSDETISIYATNIEYKNQVEIDIQVLDGDWENCWEALPILSQRDKEAPTLEALIKEGTLGH
jgi:dTDP-4-dehydrorhamnose 3,5-epimerase-like enzyme